MKKYKKPALFTKDKLIITSSSFKQVANAFVGGVARGVKAGMRGNPEKPLSLEPVVLMATK